MRKVDSLKKSLMLGGIGGRRRRGWQRMRWLDGNTDSICFYLWLSNWKDWCWDWNSNTLATSWEELTHWKRPWCWEGLGAGGAGDDRGWDGWMVSPTRWTWVWVNSRSWWWTGRPDVLRFMGSQRCGHTEWLNWTELNIPLHICTTSSLSIHLSMNI